MSPTTPQTSAGLQLLLLLLSVLASVAICSAAILMPAPPTAAPVIVVFCVGAPLFAAWQAPNALSAVRMLRSRNRALAKLRASLDKLPEVEHPLGL